MSITQEMNYLMLQMEEQDIEYVSNLLMKEQDQVQASNKIVELFLKSNIKKVNSLHNQEFIALLNEQGTFYFYERKE